MLNSVMWKEGGAAQSWDLHLEGTPTPVSLFMVNGATLCYSDVNEQLALLLTIGTTPANCCLDLFLQVLLVPSCMANGREQEVQFKAGTFRMWLTLGLL